MFFFNRTSTLGLERCVCERLSRQLRSSRQLTEANQDLLSGAAVSEVEHGVMMT